MGQYRLTVTAVGGHGCERGTKDGGKVFGCGLRSCPDCECRDFVQRMQQKGQNVEAAILEHWPGTESQVTDDLLTRIRKGSF